MFEKLFKKKSRNDHLDDVSYIKDMKHTSSGDWQQYDVLLNARGYGWSYCVDTAHYMSKADLKNIGTISVCTMANTPEKELIEEYRNNTSIKSMKSLQNEMGVLGIGGISQEIGAPVKIVWFNQTRVIRIFTTVDNEDLMKRYFETMIRRTFHTPNAMKLAKPADV